MFPWDDLRVFLAAFRHASLTKAAGELDVSVSTVSRRLTAFEETLGQGLFVRTNDGLVPTAVALVLVPHAERVEQEMLDAQSALVGLEEAPSGLVRIAAPDDMTHLVLLPKLRTLIRRHPGLRLSIVQGYGLEDPGRREADIAIRVGRPNRGDDLLVTRLRDVELGFFASPRYLAEIARPEDPRAHRWLDSEAENETFNDRWFASIGCEPVVRLNKLTSVRIAAAAGLGIALMPTLFAALTPGLVAVPLSIPVPPPMPLHMVTHRAIRQSPRVRVVWDFLDDLIRWRPDRDDIAVILAEDPDFS
jgi:DNA-binding transcriptional LysR family regulator